MFTLRAYNTSNDHQIRYPLLYSSVNFDFSTLCKLHYVEKSKRTYILGRKEYYFVTCSFKRLCFLLITALLLHIMHSRRGRRKERAKEEKEKSNKAEKEEGACQKKKPLLYTLRLFDYNARTHCSETCLSFTSSMNI